MNRRDLLKAAPWMAAPAAGAQTAPSGRARLEFKSRQLRLKHTWTTVMSSSVTRDTFHVEYTRDGVTGRGEGAPIIRYQESAAQAIARLEKERAWLEAADPWKFTKLMQQVFQRIEANFAAKAALDIALLDWVGQRLGVPLYRFFGLDPADAPVTTFSIGIDKAEVIREKVKEAAAYPVLKIKVGLDNDEEVIGAVRSVTNKPLRVDANEGFKTKEQAVEKILWLEKHGIEFMEQPLPAANLEDMNWIRKRVHVPIIADEARTFGMADLFRQIGIYSPLGQLYQPEDRDQLSFYKEAVDGQILEEGINEAGAMCSWIAAATSYSTNNVPMIPFFIFYSMFGLQRVGDLVWAAGDMRARGFLMGGTAGRTTLNGEGLQHEDGHSHILSSMIPNCRSWDPTFAYEVAVIIQDGLRRMVEEQEDVFYYITVMNENYAHPALPEGAREGILRGMYRLPGGAGPAKGPRVQLLGSGTILREVIAAAELLAADWGVASDVWSCPSFTELRRDGIACARWNLLHPADKPRQSWVEQCLAGTKGPVVASTDYVRAFADQIREFVPRRYKALGTDGFGRSDSRENLRRFFEVDRHYVAVAALKALAEDGELPAAKVAEAIAKYGIEADRPAPWAV